MAEAQHPPEPQTSPPARPSLLAAALPYIATAVAAVLLSLLIQNLLLPPRQLATPAATTAAASSTAPSAATPTEAAIATPSPAMPTAASGATPSPGDGLLRLEILDLEEADRRLWSALYLLRAASQIDDAVQALQNNDLAEADRTLLTAYRSLDRAYAVSAESDKGPIDTFRIQISRIRDDLRLRPEGADLRLRQLRQLMLSLVDEGQ